MPVMLEHYGKYNLGRNFSGDREVAWHFLGDFFVTIISESLSMDGHWTFSCNTVDYKLNWKINMLFLVKNNN